MLSDEQRSWIEDNRLARDRWLYSSNARPMIDDLCGLGFMQAASGEFGPLVDKDETIHLAGRDIPVMVMTSLYMLTPNGRDAISAPE